MQRTMEKNKMVKIQLIRDKHIIHISKPDCETKLLFDLKEQTMKKYDKKKYTAEHKDLGLQNKPIKSTIQKI